MWIGITKREISDPVILPNINMRAITQLQRKKAKS